MITKLQEAIENCATKSMNASATDTLHRSQAALNMAQTINVLESIEKGKGGGVEEPHHPMHIAAVKTMDGSLLKSTFRNPVKIQSASDANGGGRNSNHKLEFWAVAYLFDPTGVREPQLRDASGNSHDIIGNDLTIVGEDSTLILTVSEFLTQ